MIENEIGAPDIVRGLRRVPSMEIEMQSTASPSPNDRPPAVVPASRFRMVFDHRITKIVLALISLIVSAFDFSTDVIFCSSLIAVELGGVGYASASVVILITSTLAGLIPDVITTWIVVYRNGRSPPLGCQLFVRALGIVLEDLPSSILLSHIIIRGRNCGYLTYLVHSRTGILITAGTLTGSLWRLINIGWIVYDWNRPPTIELPPELSEKRREAKRRASKELAQLKWSPSFYIGLAGLLSVLIAATCCFLVTHPDRLADRSECASFEFRITTNTSYTAAQSSDGCHGGSRRESYEYHSVISYGEMFSGGHVLRSNRMSFDIPCHRLSGFELFEEPNSECNVIAVASYSTDDCHPELELGVRIVRMEQASEIIKLCRASSTIDSPLRTGPWTDRSVEQIFKSFCPYGPVAPVSNCSTTAPVFNRGASLIPCFDCVDHCYDWFDGIENAKPPVTFRSFEGRLIVDHREYMLRYKVSEFCNKA